VFDEEGALHSEEDSFHSDPRLTKREKIKEEFASFDNDGYSLPSLKGYFNSKKSRGGQNEKK
jgi:hypothetical protein